MHCSGLIGTVAACVSIPMERQRPRCRALVGEVAHAPVSDILIPRNEGERNFTANRGKIHSTRSSGGGGA